eukprot:1155105-Pelagomonas_calceolata.AAC.1
MEELWPKLPQTAIERRTTPVSPIYHKATRKGLVENWRAARSARLQNLAVTSILVFNGAPSRNEL